MNRLLLPYYLILILWIPLISQAQSFELSETEIYYKGEIGDYIEIPVEIKNITGEPVSIVIQRAENNISNGQASSICWGQKCADNNPILRDLEPNKKNDYIVANFEAGLSQGYSSVKYVLFNRNNPQDAVDLVIHYTINEPTFETTIYNSNKIQIEEVYPNPVSDFLYINYSFKDDGSTAKVGVHNVLGSVVNEYKLEPLEHKAKINTTELNPGVYFYSLSVNNETVLIKKFVVRK